MALFTVLFISMCSKYALKRHNRESEIWKFSNRKQDLDTFHLLLYLESRNLKNYVHMDGTTNIITYTVTMMLRTYFRLHAWHTHVGLPHRKVSWRGKQSWKTMTKIWQRPKRNLDLWCNKHHAQNNPQETAWVILHLANGDSTKNSYYPGPTLNQTQT